jgi:hypothetical protein
MRPAGVIVNFAVTKEAWTLSQRDVRFLLMVPLLLLQFGCRAKRPQAPATPSPRPSARPIALAGEARASRWSLWEKGKKILEVELGEASVVPQGRDGNLRGSARGQRATLFRAGRPHLRFTGDVVADTKAQTLQVSGGASATLLGEGGGASLSSDTMLWRRGDGRIQGKGRVRARLANISLVGESFVADDALTTIRMKHGNQE